MIYVSLRVSLLTAQYQTRTTNTQTDIEMSQYQTRTTSTTQTENIYDLKNDTTKFHTKLKIDRYLKAIMRRNIGQIPNQTHTYIYDVCILKLK